jgi:NADP-dependent 3-hydroxy acid dehydrogenase YdfG
MKTWFITGTSRGFGREWAIAALERGDKVAATARNLEALDELAAKYGDAVLPLELDVTDGTRPSPPSGGPTTASAGWTSSSTTPATATSA